MTLLGICRGVRGQHFGHLNSGASNFQKRFSVCARSKMQNIYELGIQKQYFDLIKEGKKSVEGRINRPSYALLQKGALIRFVQAENRDGILHCNVRKVNRYPSFMEMLVNEGLHNCLPNTQSLEEGVAIYHGFSNYEQDAERFGVIAIHVEPNQNDVS